MYPFKPVSQESWESKVSTASVAAATVEVDVDDPSLTPDLRPKLYDYNSQKWFLLDTGAAVSCYPRSAFPQAKQDPNRLLQAVNGAKVPTYGTQTVKINLGGRTYNHDFVLADLPTAICGWDFILRYHLDIVWQGDQKCTLVDKGAKKSFPLGLQKVKKSNVSLSMVTFKQYSEQQKVLQSEPTVPIPPEYRELIDQHKGILDINFHKEPKHNIIHTINTGSNKPCRARARPLMVGSPKYVSGEKAIKELEKLGVIERIGPGEATHWSSALHLATKSDGSQRPCSD